MDCIFCKHIQKEDIIFETNFFQAVYDLDPVQDGHIPRYLSDEFWDHLQILERPIDKHKLTERLKGAIQI